MIINLSPEFEIRNRNIGDSQPCFIIAEACDNHKGSLDTAKEMITQAKIAGADAIKFQHHLPDEEMLPDIPMSDNFDEPLYEFLKKYALTLDQHIELKEFCEKEKILYMCTPFSLKAALEINNLVQLFKIGSGEMTDIPTLKAISKLEKPMILSTGMSSFDEIDRTYQVLIDEDTQFALLNCVSEYPPVYEDLNLGVIKLMKEKYPKAIIGHSDHTPDLYTSFAAVSLGAKIIEKHVILDKNDSGPDQSVSIDFKELAQLVEGIRKIEVGLGNKKIVHAKEKQIREWAFRSLVSTKYISKGSIIKQEDIWSKRPGTGIPSHLMDRVIGKIARENIPSNKLLEWDDFIEEK